MRHARSDEPADYVDVDRDAEALRLAEQERVLLEGRARGLNVTEIIDEHDLKINARHAYTILRKAADRIRAENASLVAQRIMEHDERCEYLYRLCVKRIQAIADSGGFDHNVLRAAVAVLERQAKLLGLDKDRAGGHAGSDNAWLDKATPQALVEYAERLGLKVPEPFKAGAEN